MNSRAATASISFVLNGARTSVRVHPMRRLLDVLREECGLTGTKEGCGEGECGACTVIVDGKAVNACLVPISQVRRASVLTIEGLNGQHPLQQTFVTQGGAQCGICTPGMIMAAVALGPNPTLEQVRVGLAGNLCRCTGYLGIYRAIKAAARAAKSPALGPKRARATTGARAPRNQRASQARAGGAKRGAGNAKRGADNAKRGAGNAKRGADNAKRGAGRTAGRRP
jgi:carbon-monoxide dehydrogenase small subunit